MITQEPPQPPLIVPVRNGGATLALRLFRTAAGKRTAVAFTSVSSLERVLGTGQSWVRLSEYALRGLLVDLNVIGIRIDPAGVMTEPVHLTAVPDMRPPQPYSPVTGTRVSA